MLLAASPAGPSSAAPSLPPERCHVAPPAQKKGSSWKRVGNSSPILSATPDAGVKGKEGGGLCSRETWVTAFRGSTLLVYTRSLKVSPMSLHSASTVQRHPVVVQ